VHTLEIFKAPRFCSKRAASLQQHGCLLHLEASPHITYVKYNKNRVARSNRKALMKKSGFERTGFPETGQFEGQADLPDAQ